MKVYDYINSLDKEDLATLLYIIYNLGLEDNERGIDQSDRFDEELMNSDKEKLENMFSRFYPQLDL